MGENSGYNAMRNVFRDCESQPIPYIERDSIRKIYIFKPYEWNIRVYNKTFTHFNTTAKMDLNTVMNGDFEIFSLPSLRTIENLDLVNGDQERLDTVMMGQNLLTELEDRELAFEVNLLVKKFKDFIAVRNRFENQTYSTSEYSRVSVWFQPRTKICTTTCGQEDKLCLEFHCKWY